MRTLLARVAVKIILPSLMAVGIAHSQSPSTITVPVATAVTLSSSSATFNVTVSGFLPFTQDQALSALQGLGLTGANLTNIGIQNGSGLTLLSYSFSFTTSYSAVPDTLSKLNALQSAAAPNSIILTVGVNVGASSDAWNQAHQQAIPALLTQAAQQAALVATGMQVNVGSIVSVSDSSYLSGVQGHVSLVVSFAIQ
jgi:hypothetical protein